MKADRLIDNAGDIVSPAEIDALSSRFENAWRTDETPKLEAYLVELAPGSRSAGFKQLLLVEIESRQQRGESPTEEEFLDRFSSYSDVVSQVFGLLERGHAETIVQSKTSAGSGSLQVRCPHCHIPIELAVDAPLREVNCHSCGSSFSLASTDDNTRDATTVTQLGQFQLIERLGMGAFGTVWKARDTQLSRTVAVKVPRQGQLDLEETEKFFREARSAAQLHHPNIVPVHEVGRDGDSLYIVSDFIRGVTLSGMLIDGRMTFHDTARLLATIAEALDHAHQKGVVHRDLKPGNIMIDDAGEPHLMDFGLAKRETGEVTMTIEGAILGTPMYMSPEQAEGKSHEVDCTTDIYSLGAMMFQMLTGELPFRGTPQMLMHKVINEEPPSPRKLDNCVPHDLETICLKCLEKDPKRRYATGEAVAAELRRWLRNEPIEARPIGGLDRCWRWCKRNALVASLMATAAILLVAVASVATVGYVKTTKALREKERSEATATQVSEFLTGLFRSSDPLGWATGEHLAFTHRDPNDANLTARVLLQRGAGRIESELADEPDIQAQLMETIGGVYRELGLWEEASQILRRALEIRRESAPADRRAIASVMHNLAGALHYCGNYEEGESIYREVLKLRRQLLGPEDLQVTATMQGLALVLSSQEKFEESEQLLREVIDIRRRLLGNDHQSVGIALAVLAANQLSADQDEQVKSTLTEALLIFSRHHGGDLPFAAKVVVNYQSGLVALSTGDLPKAKRLLGESVEIAKVVLGEAHPFVAWGMFDYARVLHRLGDVPGALEAVEKAIQISTMNVPENHPKLIMARTTLADLYSEVGQFEAAEAVLQIATRDAIEAYGEQSPRLAECLAASSLLLQRSGQWRQAEAQSRRALELIEAAPDHGGYDIWHYRRELARCLIRNQQPREALRALQADLSEQHAGGDRALLPEGHAALTTIELLGDAYLAADEDQKAEQVMILGRTIAETGEEKKMAWSGRFRTHLGKLLTKRGQYEQAESQLSDAVHLLKPLKGANDPWTLDASAAMHSLYLAWNKPEQAAPFAPGNHSEVSPPATVDLAR